MYYQNTNRTDTSGTAAVTVFFVFKTFIILSSFYSDIIYENINQNNHLHDSVSSISEVGSVDEPGLNTAILSVFRI